MKIVAIAFQTDAMMTSCLIRYPSVVNRLTSEGAYPCEGAYPSEGAYPKRAYSPNRHSSRRLHSAGSASNIAERVHRRESTTKLVMWTEVDGISHQVYCFSRRAESHRVNLRTSAECRINHMNYM